MIAGSRARKVCRSARPLCRVIILENSPSRCSPRAVLNMKASRWRLQSRNLLFLLISLLPGAESAAKVVLHRHAPPHAPPFSSTPCIIKPSRGNLKHNSMLLSSPCKYNSHLFDANPQAQSSSIRLLPSPPPPLLILNTSGCKSHHKNIFFLNLQRHHSARSMGAGGERGGLLAWAQSRSFCSAHHRSPPPLPITKPSRCDLKNSTNLLPSPRKSIPSSLLRLNLRRGHHPSAGAMSLLLSSILPPPLLILNPSSYKLPRTSISFSSLQRRHNASVLAEVSEILVGGCIAASGLMDVLDVIVEESLTGRGMLLGI